MSTLIEVTAPTESITTAEAKLFCRVEISTDDTIFAGLITTAREYAEKYQSRAWGSRTFKLVLDGFPRVIKLPVLPLVSVSSITYFDSNGDQQTLAADQYIVDVYSKPPRITPAIYNVFPVTSPQPSSVHINFVGGGTVTAKTKTAMLELISFLYENRSDQDVAIPRAINMLLNPDCWGTY